MILHKVVERAAFVVCPACLRETPVKYSICLRCKGMMMSHGRKPVEITSAEEEEESDEDEMEVDDDVEIKQEPTAEEENDYKDAVDQGQQEADAAGRWSFDESEVDYGDEEEEQDVEMEETGQEEDEEETEPNDEDPRAREEEEKKKQAHADMMAKLPQWAHPLEVGSKSMPTEGLLNVDPDEGAARIYDNYFLNYSIRNMKTYYPLRVNDDPEKYFQEMIHNRGGRLDLDGIAPYCSGPGEELLKPTMAQTRPRWQMRAKADEHAPEIMQWAHRELKDMPMIIDVAGQLEKVTEFLVKAGFSYDKLLDFKPSKDDQLEVTRRARMQLVISNFLQTALKGACPDKESYSYFREDHGFGGLVSDYQPSASSW